MNPNVMQSVQKQKIKQTEVHLIEWLKIKQSFLKKHIPIQQNLIKNLDNASEITLLKLRQLVSILRQQKQIQQFTVQRLQKTILNDQKRIATLNKSPPSKPKNVSKKQIQNNQQKTNPIWCENIDKLFNSLSINQKNRINQLKQYIKVINKYQQQLSKQQLRYSSQLKKIIKNTEKTLQKIDSLDKQQQSIISNICKDSKNKQRDGNYFLIQYKKFQQLFKNQFILLVQRSGQIFNLMKFIIDSQKNCVKKIKQIIQQIYKVKNIIFKQNQFDQRILGLLVVMEDGVAEDKKKWFDKRLLNIDQIEEIKIMVQEPNQNGITPNLQTIVRYLKLTLDDFFNKLNAKNKFNFFIDNLAYRKWDNASLAQGWLISTFNPIVIYLTFDGSLSLISKDGDFIRKINVKQTIIKKIDDRNVVYIQQKIRGFFSDSQQQYQVKFQKDDTLDEFVLFIQNKIT